MDALDEIDLKHLKNVQELKSLANPPREVANLLDIITGHILSKDKKLKGWRNANKHMGNPKKFVQKLKQIDYDSIEDWQIKKVK
jgi:hypothetical protein